LETNADARRCGEVIVFGVALLAPKATEPLALPSGSLRIAIPEKSKVSPF
jgi:hypothetical protein